MILVTKRKVPRKTPKIPPKHFYLEAEKIAEAEKISKWQRLMSAI